MRQEEHCLLGEQFMYCVIPTNHCTSECFNLSMEKWGQPCLLTTSTNDENKQLKTLLNAATGILEVYCLQIHAGNFTMIFNTERKSNQSEAGLEDIEGYLLNSLGRSATR